MQRASSTPIRLPDGDIVTDYQRGDFCNRCGAFIPKGRNDGEIEAVDRRTYKGPVDMDAPIRDEDHEYEVDVQVCGDCMDEFRIWLDGPDGQEMADA